MIRSVNGKTPKIHPGAFVSEAAYVIGDVEIGEGSSVWPGSVVRGDAGKIVIGKNTCIQDNSVVHGDADVDIGDDVVVAHRVVCHGRSIGNRVLLGNGCIVNDGVHIGDDSLAEARFSTMALRKTNEAELDVIIADWCANQDASEAEATLGALGLTAARVVPLCELYSNPDTYFVESGFVTRVDHPEAGTTWLPGRPWRFSAASSTPVRAAPCVGQHSREVLSTELGLDDAEYAALVTAGVTGTLDEMKAAE